MHDWLTPKECGPHRRFRRQDSSRWSAIALVAVFVILVLMYFLMPPIA
jgi:hypothetical protein